jgi:hypothetical protein
VLGRPTFERDEPAKRLVVVAVAAGAEHAKHLPGLAELFEQDHPGMHTTNTLDYDIVLDGEIWLELDDGVQTHLRAGDVAIQCGTRHAWRNLSERTTTMAFVLVGAHAMQLS